MCFWQSETESDSGNPKESSSNFADQRNGQTAVLAAGPCGQSVAMQRLLVPPNLKVYNISDLEALSELVAGLLPDSTLASKLRQLLGFQTVGNDGRQGRQMAGNWLRLHSVVRSAPAQTCARSGRESNSIRIFKHR